VYQIPLAEPYVILIGLLVGWVSIYLVSRVLPFNRYGLEAHPLYLLYKTERFNTFLLRLSEKHQRFWRIFATVGLGVSIFEMALAIYFLTFNLHNFLFTPQAATPIVPMLPGVTINLRWVPYILIAIGITATTHEMAHGILAYLEQIPVKSSGLFLLPIAFGAFVELDDDVFKTAKLVSKLRILVVGSLTNLATGLVATILLFSLFTASSSGVLVMAVSVNGPADEAGIQPWTVIYRIDGVDTRNLDELITFLRTLKPHVTVTVETSVGTRLLVTDVSSYNSSRGRIGLLEYSEYYPLRIGEIHPQLTYHFLMLLNWVSLILINMAIFNMLPLYPFDGEALIASILKAKLGNASRSLRIAINVVVFFLLAANIVLTFLKYGLTPL
jgi:membrane-associated protease RseP (regulator of RpoE activity)